MKWKHFPCMIWFVGFRVRMNRKKNTLNNHTYDDDKDSFHRRNTKWVYVIRLALLHNKLYFLIFIFPVCCSDPDCVGKKHINTSDTIYNRKSLHGKEKLSPTWACCCFFLIQLQSWVTDFFHWICVAIIKLRG